MKIDNRKKIVYNNFGFFLYDKVNKKDKALFDL